MLNYIQIQMVIKMIQFQIHIQMIQMMILIMILIMNLIMILIMGTSDNICKVFFHCELFLQLRKFFVLLIFFIVVRLIFIVVRFFFSCKICFYKSAAGWSMYLQKKNYIKMFQVGPCIQKKNLYKKCPRFVLRIKKFFLQFQNLFVFILAF